MTNSDFIDRLKSLDRLTKSEARVFDFFESNYPLTAFETISSIAEKAEVGKATVGRFLKRLGYESFQDFKIALQAGVVNQLDSPLSRYSAQKSKVGEAKSNPLSEHVETSIKNLHKTRTLITPEQLDEAAKLLASCEGRLCIMGTATSQSLAHYFFLLAKHLRDNVVLLDASLTSIRHMLVDVGPKDTLLVITHSRYGTMSAKVAKWFKNYNCPVVLLADKAVTLASSYADIQLLTSSHGTPLFNSRVASMVVIESLLIGMAPYLEEEFIKRHDLFNELRKEFSFGKSISNKNGPM